MIMRNARACLACGGAGLPLKAGHLRIQGIDLGTQPRCRAMQPPPPVALPPARHGSHVWVSVVPGNNI